MVRHVALPIAAILVLVAGCGGKRSAAPQRVDHAAPTAPVAKVEPAAERPRARTKKDQPAVGAPAISQPPAPELPALIDLGTTPEMLSAHALIVAREQVQAGMSGQADVAQRHAFILAEWQPLYQERLAFLGAVRDAREARVKRELAEAKIVAAHEQRLDAVDATYEPLIRAEKARTAPILER